MILREKMFAFYVESYDKLGFTGVGFCKNSVCCQMLILDSVGANCVRPYGETQDFADRQIYDLSR